MKSSQRIVSLVGFKLKLCLCVGVEISDWITSLKMAGFKDANLREGLKEKVGGVFSGWVANGLKAMEINH